MINQPTEQIEEMLTYLFNNFEVIKELVEKEKNRPKAVFGWRKGGVFNPSDKDELWGSDLPKVNRDSEEATLPTSDFNNLTKEEPEREKPFVDVYSLPEDASKKHREPSQLVDTETEARIKEDVTIVDEPKAASVEPPKEVPTEKDESKIHRTLKRVLPSTEKENNDVAPTNDTTNSSAPNLLLRDETEAERQRDNSTTSEGGGVINSSETVKDENRQGGRGVFRDKPKGEIKPKALDKSEATVSTINHDAIYEEEYKERCKKKDWEYKTKEQRHEEAKEGANRIKRERFKDLPFNDFRRLW